MSYTKKPLEGQFGEITDKALGVKNALYEFNPGKCLLPEFFEHYVEQIWDAPVREDDVWLVSYPRTGSTWCQEMIWLIGNNLDFKRAQTTLQQIRAPLLEMSVVLYEYVDHFSNLFTNSVDFVNKLPSPRFVKTHLPFQLLPAEIHEVKPKIIYTLRNPKDLCVSYYHHCKLLHGFNVTFETFCELFLNDSVAYGGLFNHYLEFWNRRHEENILIVRYEDMKKDTKGTIRKISEFMAKPMSFDEIDALSDFLNFRKMSNNEACNFEMFLKKKLGKNYFQEMGYRFIRRGEIGDWKNYMNPELSRRFDKWVQENTKGTDLCFE